MSTKETIQQSLIFWRRRASLTQTQVATLINIKQRTYAAYEERRAMPSRKTLEELCQIYGCSSVETFIDKKEEAKGNTKKDKLYYAYTKASHENRLLIDFILKEVEQR